MALRSAARAGVRLIVRSYARLHKQIAKTRRSARLIRWRILAKTWWRRVWPRIKNWSWTAIWTAIGTCVMALFTVGIYLVGRAQWHTFQRQLTAMQGQLDAMEAEQRPWVKIQKLEPYQWPIYPWVRATPNVPMTPQRPASAGLVFSPDVGFIALDFVLENVGHSPAFEIRVAVGQFFGLTEQKTDLAKEEQQRCATLDMDPPRPMVAESANLIPVLFPGDEASNTNPGVFILRTQLDKLEDQDKNGFQIVFYGCVRYKFANLKEPHQTSFAYQVAHLVDAPTSTGKATDFFFKFGEDIPVDRILLRPQPMISGITN